ncbi:hypothetical protein PROFUN_08383 [Planoprotostelium fungivorum]|uniref:Uncharacterized protein n=1 Tax=Planoprotostelium fungivorum TaxID=1890364 RepID=A0A2P6NJN4_9EUKA|nr:hypothetical protein PROFUN_08383 [Planoprotostelium fungivorum]
MRRCACALEKQAVDTNFLSGGLRFNTNASIAFSLSVRQKRTQQEVSA